MEMNELLKKLKKVKKTSNGYQALCPAHDDTRPSLSITERNGYVLVHCFAGCDVQKILKALDLPVSVLFPKKKKIVYPYYDENGKLLFEVVREGKKFRQRVKKGKTHVYSLNGVPRVPFNLPEVLKAVKENKTIYLVEGEKDALSLISLGVTATTNPGGALNNLETLVPYLKGAKVVILVDRDKPGYERGKRLFRLLKQVAREVKVMEPLEGKDITEHLELGFSLGDIVPLGKKYLTFASEVEEGKMDYLWSPYFPTSFTLVDGFPGTGKSTLTTFLVAKFSKGLTPEGKKLSSPKKCLIISYEEDYGKVILPKLKKMGANLDNIAFGNSPPPLPEGISELELIINGGGFEFVVIDPLFGAFSEDVEIYQDVKVKKLVYSLEALCREYGICIVGVRHRTKSSQKSDIALGLGGIGIAGGARSVLYTEKVPSRKGTKVFVTHIKNNYGGTGKPFYLVITDKEVTIKR
jgi:5S rRNA maturation endonuclease (ribonuclease M5)